MFVNGGGGVAGREGVGVEVEKGELKIRGLAVCVQNPCMVQVIDNIYLLPQLAVGYALADV